VFVNKTGGIMNIIELLKEDHKKVAELFARVDATDNEKQHVQLFEKIKTELETHTQIEESIFYPVLEQYEELKDLVLEAFEEHKQIKTLIREITALAEGSERLDAKLTVMGENVEHHVGEEEEEMFPKVEKLIQQQELERMGEEMMKFKKGLYKSSRAGSGSK
jgi:iron-sulfur cluster repair protein YtfE (RIC family)